MGSRQEILAPLEFARWPRLASNFSVPTSDSHMLGLQVYMIEPQLFVCVCHHYCCFCLLVFFLQCLLLAYIHYIN